MMTAAPCSPSLSLTPGRTFPRPFQSTQPLTLSSLVLIPLEEKLGPRGLKMRQTPARNNQLPEPLLCGRQLGEGSPWGPEDRWLAGLGGE